MIIIIIIVIESLLDSIIQYCFYKIKKIFNIFISFIFHLHLPSRHFYLERLTLQSPSKTYPHATTVQTRHSPRTSLMFVQVSIKIKVLFPFRI